MDSAAPALSSAQTTQLLLSTTPSSVEYDQVLRLVGQNVSAVLIEQGADGAKLELYSGQIITAKGDLPFPEQTQLQLKVSVQDGLIRLQTLEALPPSPVSILGPLVQSEADALIQQLRALKLPEALVPLAKLFDALIPSGEFQLQQAIDALPVTTRQLLSSLFNLNNNNSSLLLRTLMEHFEPIVSLLEMNLIFTDKQSYNVYSSLDNNQKPDVVTKIASNDLRHLLLKYLESNSTNYNKITETTKTEQIESLFKLITSELLSDLTSPRTDSAQSSVFGADKVNPLEKILQMLKLLPDEVRNNISDNLLTRPASDIEAVVKVIMNELRSSVSNTILGNANTDIEAIAKLISNEVRNSITNNISDKVNIDIETIAKVISNEVRNSITNNISGKTNPDIEAIAKIISDEVHSNILSSGLGKSDPDIKIIAREILDKVSINAKETDAISKENLPADTSKKLDRQKLIQTLENMPISAKKIVASVIMGSAETEPKAIAEYFTKKDISSNVKQNFNLKQEITLPILRQIITLLSNDARNNISNIVLDTDNFNVETIAKAIFEKFDIKDQTIIISKENLSNNILEKPGLRKLVQVLENMQVPIRRAVSSAIMATAEAEPKALAEFLIQKNTSSNSEQNFISKLETTSPVLRQIISLIAELKPDAPLKQTIQTILNGDKGVLVAAKTLLSLDEDTAVTSSKYDYSPYTKEMPNHSVLLASRLNYLLRFEMLNSQAAFSSQDKNSISSWFRSIVDQLIMAKTAKLEIPDARQMVSPQKPNFSTPSISSFEHTIRQDSDVVGEKPQTWQMWLKDSIKALTNPAVSSKEAIFHTLAAKENINYFELPLPWMPGRTLEMWVESDKENSNKDTEKSSNRILLALNFSELGETRVGLESMAKRLKIRVWAEHPQLIEKELPQMENELSALGFGVQISLHNLTIGRNGTIPTIKSIINASALHAMG
jgi:DNA-binding transcriptional ArsR family regulator